MLALAPPQQRIDQAGSARLPEQPRRVDRFRHRGVRRNIACTAAGTGRRWPARALRVESLVRPRQQAREQCIETHVPADAVVAQSAQQAAFLRRTRADRSSAAASSERPFAITLRDDARGLRTHCGRAAHDPSTAPSSRCALQKLSRLTWPCVRRAALRVSRSTPSPVATSMPSVELADHRSRRLRCTIACQWQRFPDAQLLTRSSGLCDRPGVERAHLAIDFDRRPRPVDPRLLLADLGRVRRTRVRLRARHARVRPTMPSSASQQRLRAEHCETIVQLRRSLASADRRRALEQHRTGVQSCIHLHDRHAGLRDRPPGSRAGSAPRRASAAAATHGCSGSRAAESASTAGGRSNP